MSETENIISIYTTPWGKHYFLKGKLGNRNPYVSPKGQNRFHEIAKFIC
jgi:hypothetical protein